MNKSKITAYTALATIMSASAAHADLSLSGLYQGNVSSGDNNSGTSHAMSTSSVYVTYGSTLDNGMGLSAGFSITGASMGFSTAIDTGMGTIGFGQIHSSAVDGMDSMPAGATAVWSNSRLNSTTSYSDGDVDEGMGIKYTSPSINGWTVAVSMGEDTANTFTKPGTRNTSIAAKGSLMGLSLAAGAVDDSDGTDDNFMTVGYSVAGVSMGYGVYDDDNGSESTIIGLNTSVAGLSLGYTFEDLDATTDKDASVYSVGKNLGGMNVTLQFTDIDDGSAVDNQAWNIIYSVGF
ncbi:porin [Pelagibacterales bacterium]|nr:porin [Pelagibacterales bacterium]